MEQPGITVENLADFRRALKASGTGAEKSLREGLRAAGVPVKAAAVRYAPHRTGLLEHGYAIRVSGASAFVGNKVPYAGGAEWGRMGKWSGFNKYPAPSGGGRFAWKAVYDERDTIEDVLNDRLREVIGLQGWAT